MFIVGIDIAKHTHQASVMNPDGSLIGKSIKISNTSSGFEAFIAKLKDIDPDLSHFEFGMESTGHYWLNLYTHLSDLSHFAALYIFLSRKIAFDNCVITPL